jgi:glutathione S-transferase
MRAPLNMAQLTLACTLGFQVRLPAFEWRARHPKLGRWLDPIAARPSFVATKPL